MIVYLEWADSCSLDGWTAPGELHLPPDICRSVGKVIHEPTQDEPWWTICGDWGETDEHDVARIMTIPAGMVQGEPKILQT